MEQANAHKNNSFVIRGNVYHTPASGAAEAFERAFVVCRDGKCDGIFEELPEEHRDLPLKDYGDALILPGMVDLHLHAPQFAFRGTGMDSELLTWLKERTFPEEEKYADPAYARRAYGMFATRMRQSATTRAVIFATIHKEATITLMELMEETGLVSYVGKVNMDRDAPPGLKEKTPLISAYDTIDWIDDLRTQYHFTRTWPILTPRFIPCCSDSLLDYLGEIRRLYDLPVQSHLSENPEEMKLVESLMPDAAFYGDGYDRFGLFGGEARTVMAHCIYSPEEEVERMREKGVWIAHCPNSNMNLASGIAPVRHYLDKGMRIGLGSDVAGGQTVSIFRAVTDAVQVSKLYWRYLDRSAEPLSFAEAFYLATRGGGSFFGSAGSFEKGYEFDAIVIDDSRAPHPQPMGVSERVERAFYLGLDRNCLIAKYAAGTGIRLED